MTGRDCYPRSACNKKARARTQVSPPGGQDQTISLSHRSVRGHEEAHAANRRVHRISASWQSRNALC